VRHAGGDLRLFHPVAEHLGALPHTIDTLILLAEKTSGNLDPNEQELLTRILYELKMRFVKLD
jgi:hypothetical protein